MGSVVTSLSKQFSYLQELSGLQGSSHRAEKAEYFFGEPSYENNVKNFFLKLPNSLRKPNKNFIHFKMLTFQNVKFEMSELQQLNHTVKFETC